MDVDYLIVGLGISGTLLSRNLINEGKSVIIIDQHNPASSSRVAGGIINPVTGKRIVRSWMIEQLLPFARNIYRKIEQEWNVSLLTETEILEFFPSIDSRSAFIDRLQDEAEFLSEAADAEKWRQYFQFNYGIGKIAPCLLLDIKTMLDACRVQMVEKGLLFSEAFRWEDCRIEKSGISWKTIHAQKIIFCDGVAGANNPYFDKLPWSRDKGEAIIASIPGLPRTPVFKYGALSVVPWQDNLFWIGAAHDWKFTDMAPSELFRKKVEEQLNSWIKMPFTIVDHIVAQRPANLERKPFVGLHPMQPAIGIFNGMGGKGFSMAPYFAQQFTQYLVAGTPVQPDVEVSRFARILSR